MIEKLKYSLRLTLYPIVAKVLHWSGVSWSKLAETSLRNEVMIAQSAHIHKTAVEFQQIVGGKNIVFFTMLGAARYNLLVEIFIAAFLRYRGHSVRFVLDDAVLPIHEFISPEKRGRKEVRNYYHFKFAVKLLKAWDFPISYISELEAAVQVDFSVTERFEDIIEASLLKHFKIGVINEHVEGLEDARNKIIQSITMTSAVGKYFATQNIDLGVMSHGIYSTWGPVYQILRENNIRVLTYGRGKKADTCKFNFNYTADWWDVTEAWEEIKDRALISAENKKIDGYLESRITHKDDVMTYNFGDLEEASKTFSRFGLDKNKPVYSLFTNVLWDAASAQREIIFNNPVEWVYETIDWFINQPEKQLIIKIHPAEVVIGTKQPFKDIIDQKYPELPENIVVIEPQEEVNSWSIYNVTDVGLVHTSTVGMELPLVGVPCVVVSRTHYREKGFTIDVSSREEYFDLLSSFDASSVDALTLEEQSKKYAYLLFERYQMPLNLFNTYSGNMDIRSFQINSYKELLANETLNKVSKAVENEGISILND